MNMYNDEQNLYHYTYRKDGSESAPKAENNAAPRNPSIRSLPARRDRVQEMKPVKKNRWGLKITGAGPLLCPSGRLPWAAAWYMEQRLRQQFQPQRQQPGGYPGGH